MSERDSHHVSVLLHEALEFLKAAQGGRFLDCTLGGGGHTRALLLANPQNEVVAIDRDRSAVERGLSVCGEYGGRLTVIQSRFSEVRETVEGSFDGILADLGLSTDQLLGERGFSFKDSNSLDMQMGLGNRTASQIVNESGESDLFRMLKEGGVGSEARALVNAIIRARPIQDAAALSAVVCRTMSNSRNKKGSHPATVVFQAIRIAVNEEVTELSSLLNGVPHLAKPMGRFVVISFHSLEDKIVGRQMRDWGQGDTRPAHWPGPRGDSSCGRLLTPKAITPSEVEVTQNPSARSARMRVFEFNKK